MNSQAFKYKAHIKNGFTLIELMIVIAILAILAAIAIPAYNQYIQEARFSTLTSNINSLKIFLEDYRLENQSFVFGGGAGPASYDQTGNAGTITTNYGWAPEGDGGNVTYIVTVTDTNYDVSALDNGVNLWVRCEDIKGLNSCCDSTFAGSTTPVDKDTPGACP